MLKNKYENNISIKYIASIPLSIIASENNDSNPIIAIKNAVIIEINSVVLIMFNGFDILYICMNPVVPSNITATVDIVVFVILVMFAVTNNNIILKAIVNDVGKATFTTFNKKCFFILSLFGSRAKMNAGIPIVNVLVSDNCIGMNGYVLSTNRNNSNKNVAYSVFVMKRLADRSILFIVLLPSNTILGIDLKSESRSTNCATFLAASDPSFTAIAQSACLSAQTSFTPSPVIATVCLFFCIDLISVFLP